VHLTWRADDGTLGRFRDRSRDETLTYDEVGCSLGELPPGYRHGRDTVTLGSGDAAFAAGSDGLRHWACHRAARIRVFPDPAPLAVGTTVALAIGFSTFRVLAACRIVRVVDEPDRFGFAYGTLPSHPEAGEEAFLVERDGDAVTFTISVFWRPADFVACLGGPVTHRVQRRATDAYMRGLTAHVERSTR
jgi:uncharacterized protein (UPF0548 family)